MAKTIKTITKDIKKKNLHVSFMLSLWKLKEEQNTKTIRKIYKKRYQKSEINLHAVFTKQVKTWAALAAFAATAK